MKSLRDEVRLTAGDKDGFHFIHKVDFIGVSRFHPCAARISFVQKPPYVKSPESDKMTEQVEIIRSKRKTVTIQIKSDGRVVVRAPMRMSGAAIRQLLEEKSAWIEKHLAQIRRQNESAEPAFSPEQLRQLAEAARQDLPRRAARFAHASSSFSNGLFSGSKAMISFKASPAISGKLRSQTGSSPSSGMTPDI